MKRVLYIDIPFWGIKDGGANRSSFLWNSLIENYEVDWLEIKRSELPSAESMPPGLNDHYSINAKLDKRPFKPVIIYRYSKNDILKFYNIIKKNKYDFLFIRFLSPVRLASLARNIMPQIPVVVDVDMVLSRLSRLSWDQKHHFSNRYYLFEGWKQKIMENYIFRQNWLFFLTNSSEQETVRNNASKPENIKVLPNIMNDEKLLNLPEDNRILFFGTLTSAANKDALHYICQDIYPLLKPELSKRKVGLDIVGRGWHDSFNSLFADKKWLKYIGEVPSIQAEISRSKVIFLPLRIASGTRTRILEAACQSKAVLTTSIGLEGLDLDKDSVMVNNDTRKMVNDLILLLDSPQRRKSLGQQLRLKSRSLYLSRNVSSKMVEFIEEYIM